MANLAPPPVADRPMALVAALGELADATDSLTTAVERHDLAGLVAANEHAEALTERIRDLSVGLTDSDRARIDHERIRALRERIDLAARRNAYLIERAWAIDAATMRLLASLGRPAPDMPLHSYAPPSAPAYLDRQA
jgi:hypothetical protein